PGHRAHPGARPAPHLGRWGRGRRHRRTDHGDPVHRLQSRRPVRHDRRRAVPAWLVGKEVPASAKEGVTPPEQPDDVGGTGETPPGERFVDSTRAFVANSALMSVGTALSRLTGFLRVAAMAYALGVAESRLADAYNVANTTPNIVYELAVGGILASVFVPV